ARNLSRKEFYDFTDGSVIHGLAYYRLKMVDIDDRYSFSKIIAIADIGHEKGIGITSQSREMLTIFNPGAAGIYEYALYNEWGQLVCKSVIDLVSNRIHTIPLCQPLPAGIYYFSIGTNGVMNT